MVDLNKRDPFTLTDIHFFHLNEFFRLSKKKYQPPLQVAGVIIRHKCKKKKDVKQNTFFSKAGVITLKVADRCRVSNEMGLEMFNSSDLDVLL